MGAKRAWEALTTPTPSNRQFLVRFIAERAVLRHKKKASVRKDDIWYLIVVLQRWGFIAGVDLPSLTRNTIGGLVEDAYTAAKAMEMDNI